MRLAVGLMICMLLVACGRVSGQQSAAAVEATAQSKPAKAPPPAITDFPEAAQNLTVSGTMTGSVTSGRPSSCGAGGGSGPVLFAYGLYFQVGPVWYNLNISTDTPSYAGAGTYQGRAILTPVTATSRVPAGPEYDGRAQLVVTTDQHPDRGTIDALVTRPNGDHVTISGSWTCTPSPLLGPG